MIPATITTLAIVAIVLAIGLRASYRRNTGMKAASQQVRFIPDTIEHLPQPSGRLRDLVSHMVSDVDEHTSRVEEITAQLRAMQSGDADDSQTGTLQAMAEITAANERLQRRLEKAEQQLQTQAEVVRAHQSEARTDPLTQIYNRRPFDIELHRRSAEWQRTQKPFSLILIDIDHFKRLNDAHGHLAGDEVLVNVAKTLKSSTRAMDLLCRYGGEEFAILLPATTSADATHIAERLRLAVEAQVVQLEGQLLRITCSFGVADIATAGSSIQLVKRADNALYQSKQTGRNCTHLFNGVHCVPVAPGSVISAAPAISAIQPDDRNAREVFGSFRLQSEANLLAD